MTRILTGIQASGDFHVGNYFGAVQPMIEMQESGHTVFAMIADLHAFTSHPDPAVFRENLRKAVIAWIALGIDPEKTVLFRQSDIRAHTELTWLLLCHTPLGLLERGHAFKDKKANGLDANAGLLTYPVLMACDILLYDANIVPVGKDQKQHVEMTRDIAIKFNHQFGGDIFVVPEVQINEDVQVIPGLDGRKMSKSYGNTIPIFAEEKTLKKKIMSIPTASIPMGEPMDPDTCNVMAFHRLFENPRLTELEAEYRAGKIGFGHSKKELLALILDYFGEARQKYAELEADPERVASIIRHGAAEAHAQAEKVLAKARKGMGLPEKHAV